MSRELEELREKIDGVDRELLEALSRRMRLVEEIGEVKRKEHLEIEDVERWRNLLQQRLSWAGSMRIPLGFVRDVFELIHKTAIELEKK
jgi:chorismate mutase